GTLNVQEAPPVRETGQELEVSNTPWHHLTPRDRKQSAAEGLAGPNTDGQRLPERGGISDAEDSVEQDRSNCHVLTIMTTPNAPHGRARLSRHDFEASACRL